MTIPQSAPMGSKTRISSDDVWPLRDAHGVTPAERKRLREIVERTRRAVG